jgi:integrase
LITPGDYATLNSYQPRDATDLLAEKHKEDPVQHPAPPAPFNWHVLRHFAVSCWIEAGLSPKTVQTFAGHGSLQVTMDRYGHLCKSDDHKKAGCDCR